MKGLLLCTELFSQQYLIKQSTSLFSLWRWNDSYLLRVRFSFQGEPVIGLLLKCFFYFNNTFSQYCTSFFSMVMKWQQFAEIVLFAISVTCNLRYACCWNVFYFNNIFRKYIIKIGCTGLENKLLTKCCLTRRISKILLFLPLNTPNRLSPLKQTTDCPNYNRLRPKGSKS